MAQQAVEQSKHGDGGAALPKWARSYTGRPTDILSAHVFIIDWMKSSRLGPSSLRRCALSSRHAARPYA